MPWAEPRAIQLEIARPAAGVVGRRPARMGRAGRATDHTSSVTVRAPGLARPHRPPPGEPPEDADPTEERPLLEEQGAGSRIGALAAAPARQA